MNATIRQKFGATQAADRDSDWIPMTIGGAAARCSPPATSTTNWPIAREPSRPGGIGAIHQMVKTVWVGSGRSTARLHLLKRHLPYSRERPRPEHRLQPPGRRQPPGAPRSPPQRRGLPRRPRGPTHPRPDHRRGLLPPLRRGRRRAVDGHLQRDPAAGLEAAARRLLRRGLHRRRRDAGPHATAGASRAWTSPTTGRGATTRWWSRWPTPPSRCSWSTAAATGPRTSTPTSTSTRPPPCAAGRGSARSPSGATPTSRQTEAPGPLGPRRASASSSGSTPCPTSIGLAERLPDLAVQRAGAPAPVHDQDGAPPGPGAAQGADRLRAAVRHPEADRRGGRRVRVPPGRLQEDVPGGRAPQEAGRREGAVVAVRAGPVLLLHHQRPHDARRRRSCSWPTTAATRRT